MEISTSCEIRVTVMHIRNLVLRFGQDNPLSLNKVGVKGYDGQLMVDSRSVQNTSSNGEDIEMHLIYFRLLPAERIRNGDV